MKVFNAKAFKLCCVKSRSEKQMLQQISEIWFPIKNLKAIIYLFILLTTLPFKITYYYKHGSNRTKINQQMNH